MLGTSTYPVPLQQGPEEESYMYFILGHHAHLHDFGIVVDEIMTGGHTKAMLSTMEKPKIFRKSVQFITMGKWLKCGMVLGSKRQQTI